MLLLSLIFCFYSYYNIDPIKRRLSIILSLIIVSFIINFSVNVIYRYFICILFLRGIFVIIVYFSSLSSYINKEIFFVWLAMFFRLFFLVNIIFFDFSFDSFISFYYNYNSIFVLYVIFNLIYFLNFCRYFLNFSGGFRKL